MRRLYLAALPLLLAFAPLSLRGAAAAEKLLLGFEEAELRKIAGVLKKKVVAVDGGFDLKGTTLSDYNVFLRAWQVRGDKASQGKYAYRFRASGYALRRFMSMHTKCPPTYVQPAAQMPYYGGIRAYGVGTTFNTCSIFQRIFPIDWSAYDSLRFDVYCEGVKHTLQVVLEDEDIEPPIVRNIQLEPGKWNTVEIDLKEAVKARGLDLKRMATLYVFVTEGTPVRAWMDNLRLSSKDSPTQFPALRDRSPLVLTDYYLASKGPKPEPPLPGKPDRSPITLAAPFVINVDDTKNLGVIAGPCAWAAAYDNKHLTVGYTQRGTRCAALQSADGGATWTGLDGGKAPTAIPIGNPFLSSAPDAVADRYDLFVLCNLGCSGIAKPAMRLYAQKLTFTGTGWKPCDVPPLVECDMRHCNRGGSVIRLPSGRLWAAYGIVGRLGTTGLTVRYSDDGGAVWKSWKQNRCGGIPDSFAGGSIGTYESEQPLLVQWGDDGVACLWYELNKYSQPSDLRWARFDGTAWSPIEKIAEGAAVARQPVHSRRPVRAVSLAGKDIFLASARFNGILHYSNGAWKKELLDAPAGSQISLAGDKVVVIAAVKEKAAAATVIRCWQRSAAGVWSAGRDVATEQVPLAVIINNGMGPAFVAPAYAPPNFVPVAWTCKDQKWIKFLRVPVTQ